MSETPVKTGLARLLDPFTANEINVLPKPYKKESPKGKCTDPRCLGFHGLPAAHLDYVGHAALTRRPLESDPRWAYRVMAQDAHGLPIFDASGGLWIELTVDGVTRPGYGDSQGKTGPNAVKEAIGDALRNAAMRFGAALELWHKGDLYEASEERGDTVKEEPKDTRSEVAAPTSEQIALVTEAIKLIKATEDESVLKGLYSSYAPELLDILVGRVSIKSATTVRIAEIRAIQTP